MRAKNPKPLLDTSKLRKGHKVEVNSTFGLSAKPDYIATVVEPTTISPVLADVPANRQMTVRPNGKRKATVIDKAWVVRRV